MNTRHVKKQILITTRTSSPSIDVSRGSVSDDSQIRQTSDQGSLSLFKPIIFNIELLYINEYYRQLHLHLASTKKTARTKASVPLLRDFSAGISDDSQLIQGEYQAFIPLLKTISNSESLYPGSYSTAPSRDTVANTAFGGESQPVTLCRHQCSVKNQQKECHETTNKDLPCQKTKLQLQNKKNFSTYSEDNSNKHKDKSAQRRKESRINKT